MLKIKICHRCRKAEIDFARSRSRCTSCLDKAVADSAARTAARASDPDEYLVWLRHQRRRARARKGHRPWVPGSPGRPPTEAKYAPPPGLMELRAKVYALNKRPETPASRAKKETLEAQVRDILAPEVARYRTTRV